MANRPQIDLTGAWDFYPDVGNATDPNGTAARIIVPGSWQAQGFGSPGGTIPSANIGPGTSPAPYLRHNLMARCLYVRNLVVPKEWRGGRVFLCVRRAYRYTDLTINNQQIGAYEGFCSPFEFDVTAAVAFGETNQIVLGVDNRPRRGRDTLGTGNLYGNWGGIGGKVYLELRPDLWIQDVFALPNIAKGEAVLKVTLRRANTKTPGGVRIAAEISRWEKTGITQAVSGRAESELQAPTDATEFSAELPVHIRDPQLWTPDHPNLYVAQVKLNQAAKAQDEVTVRFGLREITAQGRELRLNGKPLYLSGYGDDATEPITGMLPADKNVYLERLSRMRSYGFIFVRHHSCVPHDEYFEAADEVGMLVQPEAGLAYTGFWRSGWQLFEHEWPNIVRAFRNHPSIWAWCMGNELFLNELPESTTNEMALPLKNGPLASAAGERNGVFGVPGSFPTNSFKQSNYYRDIEAAAGDQSWTLLGNAKISRVFTDGPHELGLRLISSTNCLISKIRYYRVPEETGAHTGRIWDDAGHALAQAAFRNESASGWQETTLDRPVHIAPNRAFVVSVNANTAYGATPGDHVQGPSKQEIMEVVSKAYRQAKELDPIRLIHASDGGTTHKFTDVISGGGGEPAGPKPHLLHEYGTYCSSLPDLSLIPRLDGVIRPLTYERAEKFITDNKLGLIYPRLYESSLHMRADAQKHYIENAKLSRDNAGFTFWLGVDFPDSPEGCWDEGILNQLWEPKPYLTDRIRDYAGPTVLLSRLTMDKRSFHLGNPPAVEVILWHYGQSKIANANLTWKLIEGDKTIQQGEIKEITCSPGQTQSLGQIQIDPLSGDRPRFVKLDATLGETPDANQQVIAHNSWDFYGYPRIPEEIFPGVYSDSLAVPSVKELTPGAELPSDLKVLITRTLKKERHQSLLKKGNAAILLLGNGGFKENRTGYFVNQYGAGFGGIIEPHPIFEGIPHQNRLHPGLYQLIAGGGIIDCHQMPAALAAGSVVWGLQLTGWISPEKNLQKVTHFSEVITDNNLHPIICNMDLLSNKPESQFILRRTLDYLLKGKLADHVPSCSSTDLESLLR